MKKNTLTYQQAGVDYDIFDFVKKMAQDEGRKTIMQSDKTPFKEQILSRGESAYVMQFGSQYVAFVQEGLGTKSLVADEMGKITKKTYYDTIAQDTVAAIINDLITVGARPILLLAYWGVGDSAWFTDKKRSKDLIVGWRKACELAGVVWGGGETPTNKDIINPNTIDLAGSAFGLVQSKKELVVGEKLKAGDVMVFLESSGIHANGLTLARKLADRLPHGYATKLFDGKMYGETLLKPTIIYSRVVGEILDNGIIPSYMVNITGHGWRKIMRHTKPFRYIVEKIPEPSPLFQFIQQEAGLSDSEMYATFNMGAGFVLFVRSKDAQKIISLAKKNNLNAWVGGRVEKGEKQVIIKPLGITYTAKDLNIR